MTWTKLLGWVRGHFELEIVQIDVGVGGLLHIFFCAEENEQFQSDEEIGVLVPQAETRFWCSKDGIF